MNSNRPLVSVCIPTFNLGSLIGDSIRSVLNQTCQDFELIICDDCSTDDTTKVVEQFDDPRIRFYVNEHNIGIFRNFNRTIEHVRGKYIKFLCADDKIHPQYLEKAVALFEAFPQVGIVTAFHVWIDTNGRVISRHAPWRLKGPAVISGKTMLRRAPWRHNEIGMPSHAMLRQEVIAKCGRFDLEYKHVADWELWLRIFSEYDAGFLREYLVEIRIHSRQQSRVMGASLITARDVFQISQRHYGKSWWLKHVLRTRQAEAYFWGAIMQCLRGDVTGGWRMLRLLAHHASWALLTIYMALYFPVRVWHSLRRRYCLGTGRVWET